MVALRCFVIEGMESESMHTTSGCGLDVVCDKRGLSIKRPLYELDYESLYYTTLITNRGLFIMFIGQR